MIVPVMAIANLVLTRQIYSEETNSAHAHNRGHVPLTKRLKGRQIGTLRYSGRGRGGRQPEVKCSILGIISIMPQRRPEVATVKTRSLAAS